MLAATNLLKICLELALSNSIIVHPLSFLVFMEIKKRLYIRSALHMCPLHVSM
jgi:hypothetical protein